MVKRRSNNATGRMDAAIDHFTPMGYPKADIRRTVNRLLKPDMYGKDGWPLLELDCYYAVQEALLDKEQEEKLQLQLLQEQEEEEGEEQQLQLPQEEELQVQEGEDQLQLPQAEQLQLQVEVQQQEATMQEAPLENDMPIVNVHNEVPSEAVLAVEETEEVPMIIYPPAPKATLPLPPATGTGRKRLPCYGWISESESDSDNEEQPASQQHEVHVPSPGGDLLCGRKRLSRWDVR